MKAPRGPLRAFLAADAVTPEQATAALRLVFLGIFAAQALVALATGLAVSAALPVQPRPNDVFALVLVVMAAAHLPLAWLLPRAAAHAGGRQAALSATVLNGVLSSVPAWFAALMLISHQRPPYLLAVLAILAAAYAFGFLAASRAGGAALRPSPADALSTGRTEVDDGGDHPRRAR